jgi:hypothetical protein
MTRVKSVGCGMDSRRVGGKWFSLWVAFVHVDPYRGV